MSSNLKNLSDYDFNSVPDASKMKFGIVVSEWHNEITENLFKGAFDTLIKHGAKEKNILKKYVPGSFELTIGAQLVAEYTEADAIICLGCVIQGETPHFTFVCQGVTHGITELTMEYNRPFIYGLLTTNTLEQAQERSGGKHGNKGDECAVAAIKMVAMQDQLSK